MTIPTRVAPLFFAFLMLAVTSLAPLSAHAAAPKPECILIASTPRGYAVYAGDKDIEIHGGERIILGWIGQNATKSEDRTGKGISNVGLQILTANGSGEFAYTFSNDSGSVSCSANLVMKNVVAPVSPSVTVNTTGSGISVSDIPLLSGGVATAGTSIPVTYVKVENTSSSYAVIKGFTLVQTGTADTTSIIGFSTSDNTGGSRTTVGGVQGDTPFDDREAYVPLAATLAPSEFRIYTLKAILTREATGQQGKTFALNLKSIDTTARISGALPIRGTVWTLGF